ncbi:hypothetical protein BSP75_19620 [Aeromonas sp. YN13HZO-058]|nr:hypothetical protein BSP75_19620 [Aeromonas sp. YN13HZO-058]
MFNHELILNHIDDIFGQDMHAKRVLSLANATLGVIESGSLAIHAIVADWANRLMGPFGWVMLPKNGGITS